MELSKKRMLDIAEALEFRSKNTEINCGKCGTTVMKHSEEEVAFYEKVVKLLQADQEGRLVVLPCRQMDNVWVIKNNVVEKHLVGRVTVTRSSGIVLHLYGHGYALEKDIGKTIFLTKEEAEEALTNGI